MGRPVCQVVHYLLGCKVSTYRKNLDFFLFGYHAIGNRWRQSTFTDGGCRGIISYTSYSRTNDCIYNGYDNINLEPNAMINIDTVAHMNMHYTQYWAHWALFIDAHRVTSHLWLKSALHASSHPCMCTCVLRCGWFLFTRLLFLFVPLLFFRPFQMSSSEFHEKLKSKPLCDFRLGTVATSDHETPLTYSKSFFDVVDAYCSKHDPSLPAATCAATAPTLTTDTSHRATSMTTSIADFLEPPVPVTPAVDVTYTEPDPAIEHVTPAPVIKYIAPSPAVSCLPFDEIPEVQVLERTQEQTEEQIVHVSAPPIMDDTADAVPIIPGFLCRRPWKRAPTFCGFKSGSWVLLLPWVGYKLLLHRRASAFDTGKSSSWTDRGWDTGCSNQKADEGQTQSKLGVLYKRSSLSGPRWYLTSSWRENTALFRCNSNAWFARRLRRDCWLLGTERCARVRLSLSLPRQEVLEVLVRWYWRHLKTSWDDTGGTVQIAFFFFFLIQGGSVLGLSLLPHSLRVDRATSFVDATFGVFAGYGWRCSSFPLFCRVKVDFHENGRWRCSLEEDDKIAGMEVLFRRVSRTMAQLHQYALLWAHRIQWLCPEHDLKLFTCFCVSSCRKFFGQNSEGQPVIPALHLCDVHHSLHMHERNFLVWTGGSILYSSPFQHLQRVVCLCRAVRRHDLFPRDFWAHEWTDDFGFIHDQIRVVFQRASACCFLPQSRASCQHLVKKFVSHQRDCFILRILTSYALTVVLLHTCPKNIHPRQLSLFPEHLELPFSNDEILSGYEEIVSSGTDHFTAWVKMNPHEVLVQLLVDIH